MKYENPNYPGHTLEVTTYRMPLETEPHVIAVNVSSDNGPAICISDKCSADYVKMLKSRLASGAIRIVPKGQ